MREKFIFVGFDNRVEIEGTRPGVTQDFLDREKEVRRQYEEGDFSTSTDSEERSLYLCKPGALACHPDLGVLIADTQNNRILRYTPQGIVEKFAGWQSEKSGPNPRYHLAQDDDSLASTEEVLRRLALEEKEEREQMKRAGYLVDETTGKRIMVNLMISSSSFCANTFLKDFP
eukprot:jgi/Bigna1/129170/aug1.8_g3878